MTSEGVEFLDAEAARPGDDDVLTTGGPDDGRRPTRFAAVLVGAVVVALVAAFLVARVAGGDDAPSRPQASASPSVVGRPSRPVTTPVVGLVGLPGVIGTPRELVTARSGDVVWMLDRGAGIVRVENGAVTAVQLLESQATALAVSPDGSRLYVATAAGRPSIQELDATTLTLGASRPLAGGSVQAMAVSIDAVWAATGSQLLRLDVDSLATLDTLAMPGVVLTEHLRVGTEASSDDEVVTGLVTSAGDDGTTSSRFLRVDPLTQRVQFGNALRRVVDVASTNYLSWVTYAPTAGGPQTTQGFDSVVDRRPVAEATPDLVAGTRIYDGGAGYAAFFSVAPNSSVLTCHDDGGFATSEVDVAPALPDAVISGPVARTEGAFYVITDRGLVREGAGACR